MIFEFLKYLQPTHYFQLKINGKYIYPIIESLPDDIKAQLSVDYSFKTHEAQEYDLSWQAIYKGYIGVAPTYESFKNVTLFDNYHFIRKYFHPAWVLYVLIIRLVTFHNPFKEITNWFKTRHVKRSTSINEPIVYEQWETFQSPLVMQKLKVSVIIPTLNRYHYLKDVLKDLEAQDYSNFEVIVVDQSDNFNPEFYNAFSLNFQIVQQEEKALWLARNNAIKRSKGDFVALSEDDVRIEPDWISSHLKCLDFFNAEISAGVFYPDGQQIPKERSFFAVASQFATGNAMLYKKVFQSVGLFDRQFEKQRMGDGEFGLRNYLKGVKSISNPFASCVDVKAATGGLREMGSWDAFRPSSFLAPRPIPSVLYFFRRYFGNRASRYAMLRTVPISIIPYQFKKNKPLLVIGVLLTILIFPFIVYQVFKSWSLASKKINEGPIINDLE
ncbi:glycosyltransferase family 2 protein [Psychroserpens sp. MEBiC05023]